MLFLYLLIVLGITAILGIIWVNRMEKKWDKEDALMHNSLNG